MYQNNIISTSTLNHFFKI